MRNYLLAAASAAALLMAGPADAAFSFSPGVVRALNFAGGQPNEGVGPLAFAPNVLVNFGNNVLTDKTGTYMAEYLGAEAGNNNAFTVPGFGSLFTGGNTNAFSLAGIGAPLFFNVGATGLLNFRFVANSVGFATLNGANVDDVSVAQNSASNASFVSLVVNDKLYLFYDDQGGQRPNGSIDDDNHDDMVVRITFVPEPASLLLMGAGLLGLGVATQRRRRGKVDGAAAAA